MSHARADSTTLPTTAPPAVPAPGRRGDAVGSARRIGLDPSTPPPVPLAATGRGQIVLVASLLGEASPTGGFAGPPDDDVLVRAVADVHAACEAFGGETAAVLGARVVVTFGADRAADAVSAAVEVQREAARSHRTGRRWGCAVSVVAGEVPAHPILARLGVHVVGPVVDRALALGRSARAGTVVVDERTARPATGPARSPASVPGRGEGGEGAGPDGPGASVAAPPAWHLGTEPVLLDLGEAAVACFEVEFDPDAPSRTSRVSVSTSTPPDPRAGRSARPNGGRRPRPGGRGDARPSASSLRRRPWSEGRVFCWFSDRGRGVITSTTGQEFYVDRRFLAVGSELAAGDRVFFVPRDPVARGRNPVAGAVLADDARLEVRVDRATEDGPALAVVSDSNGTDQVLPLDLAGLGTLAEGEWLRVRVGARDDGPVGEPA